MEFVLDDARVSFQMELLKLLSELTLAGECEEIVSEMYIQSVYDHLIVYRRMMERCRLITPEALRQVRHPFKQRINVICEFMREVNIPTGEYHVAAVTSLKIELAKLVLGLIQDQDELATRVAQGINMWKQSEEEEMAGDHAEYYRYKKLLTQMVRDVTTIPLPQQ